MTSIRTILKIIYIIDERKTPTGEMQPFDPMRDIGVFDLQLAEEGLKESFGMGGRDVSLARDILTCFPGRRGSLNIPPLIVTDVIQSIGREAPDIITSPHMTMILDRASALKQLFPDLDPQVFNEALVSGCPLLEYERKNLIKQQEDAQREREKEAPINNPLWRRPGASAEFANFQILTQGTPLAISLSPQDREDGIDYFQYLAEETNPKFGTRPEHVAAALELGADLRVLFPDI